MQPMTNAMREKIRRNQAIQRDLERSLRAGKPYPGAKFFLWNGTLCYGLNVRRSPGSIVGNFVRICEMDMDESPFQLKDHAADRHLAERPRSGKGNPMTDQWTHHGSYRGWQIRTHVMLGGDVLAQADDPMEGATLCHLAASVPLAVAGVRHDVDRVCECEVQEFVNAMSGKLG